MCIRDRPDTPPVGGLGAGLYSRLPSVRQPGLSSEGRGIQDPKIGELYRVRQEVSYFVEAISGYLVVHSFDEEIPVDAQVGGIVGDDGDPFTDVPVEHLVDGVGVPVCEK